MLIAEVCKLQGHEAIEAATGAQAIELATSTQPDLVLVDWVLPDISGTEVIRELRRQGLISPMVMLTGRSTKMDEVVGLEVGADDYVTKPFSMDELMARIRALIRRAETEDPAEQIAVIGHYTVDLGAKTVLRTLDAPEDVPEQVHLTKTEWAVLEILVRNPGRLVSGKQLLQQIWGPSYDSQTNYLRFYLARLRQKLEPEPSHPRQLLTESGMGYRFQP